MPYTDLIPTVVVIPGASENANRLANQLRSQVDVLSQYEYFEIMKFNRQSVKLLERAVLTCQQLHADLRTSLMNSKKDNCPEWERLNTETIRVVSATLEYLEKRKSDIKETEE